ncbi:MAG: TonB-dependent receptor plug domain-containing protein [Chitinophagaceae bacterium]
MQNSGQPGVDPGVTIRGIGSFNNSSPLYVVDGMFYDNIGFLNNNDIESLSILKDASAASIYGVRSANGVIIIKTKSGQLNRPVQVTYDGYVGVQIATNKLKMANSEEYSRIQFGKQNETDSTYSLKFIELYGGNGLIPNMNTNWYNELLRPAVMQSHSLDVTGGTESLNYSLGINYLNQNGIMQGCNLRGRMAYKALNWLKFGFSMGVSNSTTHYPNNVACYNAYSTAPILPAFDPINNPVAFSQFYASPSILGYGTEYGKPLATANYINDQTKGLRVLPTAGICRNRIYS